MMQRLPSLSIDIEEVDFTVSVSILSTNKQNFSIGDGQSGTSPKRIFHPDGQHDPLVLLDLILLNRVVDLLLSRPKEATKGINMLITKLACRKIVTFVLHWCNLSPLVFPDVVPLYGAKSLLTREAT